ncbi:MAG: hypothetical protein K6E40_14335 [Desulfovibrio sp.]|nr:hypothetical protein [Desulfovibrio sp.]
MPRFLKALVLVLALALAQAPLCGCAKLEQAKIALEASDRPPADLPAALHADLERLARVPGRHIGGSFPGAPSQADRRGWGRATQGSAYDPFDRVYYTLGSRQDGSSAMRVLTWGDGEEARTFVDATSFQYGRFPHQGLALYRPSAADPVRFFCCASQHEAKDREAKENTLVLNLLEWNKAAKTAEIAASWKLFDGKRYMPGFRMDPCVSPDGKWLVAQAKRIEDGKIAIGVWKVDRLLAAKGQPGAAVDAAGLAERVFVSPWGTRNIAMQSLATDGRCIYALHSSPDLSPHSVYVMDMHGRRLLDRKPSTEGLELYPEFAKHSVEGESLFFAEVGGRTCLVMDVSLGVCNVKDEAGAIRKDKYSRYSHYYVLF